MSPSMGSFNSQMASEEALSLHDRSILAILVRCNSLSEKVRVQIPSPLRDHVSFMRVRVFRADDPRTRRDRHGFGRGRQDPFYHSASSESIWSRWQSSRISWCEAIVRELHGPFITLICQFAFRSWATHSPSLRPRIRQFPYY